MLNPSVEAIWKRYNQRPGGGYTATLTPEILKTAVGRTIPAGLWLDTTDQTPDQTADDVLHRLHLAKVAPEDVLPSSADQTTAR